MSSWIEKVIQIHKIVEPLHDLEKIRQTQKIAKPRLWLESQTNTEDCRTSSWMGKVRQTLKIAETQHRLGK